MSSLEMESQKESRWWWTVQIISMTATLVVSLLSISLPLLVDTGSQSTSSSSSEPLLSTSISYASIPSTDDNTDYCRRISKFTSLLPTYLRHIGSGVILSLAFLHLLPTAFQNLQRPSIVDTLPLSEAFPGLLILLSILTFATIDQIVPVPSHFHQSITSVPSPSDQPIFRYLLLELSILLHTILIGLSLSVTPFPTLIPFSIAIVVHQALEGISLGTILTNLPSRFRKSIIVGYSLSLPIGQSLGLAYRLYGSMDDSDDIASRPQVLIFLGSINSLTAGLLIYSSLIHLIADDFLYNQVDTSSSAKQRWAAWSAVVVGATVMTILAQWA